MARTRDVFGFDELSKSFARMEKKYPNQADSLLMTAGRSITNKVKTLSPIGKTKKLRNSWRLKNVKLYKNGKVRVVRIQSQAPHAHLVEQGHEIVRGGRTRERGRKLTKFQRATRGITSGGRVEGRKMLEKSVLEFDARFGKDAEKMLNKLTQEVEL